MPIKLKIFGGRSKENKSKSAPPHKSALPQKAVEDKENAPAQLAPVAGAKKQPLKAKPRPAAAPGGDLMSPARGPASNIVVAPMSSSDDDRVLLDDWSFSFNASRPLQLTGRVFNNGPSAGYEDGDLLEYTSQIVSISGRTASTKSGTVYKLGKPSEHFERLRTQLWINSRTGAMGRDDGSSVPPLDEDQPLLGIKLGSVVATEPVRLPRVAGWSHQSGVALLNEWEGVLNKRNKMHAVGAVFNCPGACTPARCHSHVPLMHTCACLCSRDAHCTVHVYRLTLVLLARAFGPDDGADGHQTAMVVDVRGRMLITVEGAEYYLGYRKGSSTEERARVEANVVNSEDVAALGLAEEDSTLAV